MCGQWSAFGISGQIHRAAISSLVPTRGYAMAQPSGPKWESDALEQIRSHVRKFAKPLRELVERDANEGDTRVLVTDMLCDALGYDKYEDLTTEYAVRGDRKSTRLNSSHVKSSYA